jgi:hypothetical protein
LRERSSACSDSQGHSPCDDTFHERTEGAGMCAAAGGHNRLGLCRASLMKVRAVRLTFFMVVFLKKKHSVSTKILAPVLHRAWREITGNHYFKPQSGKYVSRKCLTSRQLLERGAITSSVTCSRHLPKS